MKDLQSLKHILKLGHRWHQRRLTEGAHHQLSSLEYCELVDQALSHAELQSHYRDLIVCSAAKTVDDLSDQERRDHYADLQRRQPDVTSPEDDYSSRLTNAVQSRGSDVLTNQELRNLLMDHWIEEYQNFGPEEWEALFQGE